MKHHLLPLAALLLAAPSIPLAAIHITPLQPPPPSPTLCMPLYYSGPTSAPTSISPLSPSPADTLSSSTPAPHIPFEDTTLQGDIYQYSDTLKHHGFTLDKRLRDVDAFLFHGTILGTTCYFQVSYTPSSRTVYRIMAQPKHININAYVDSITARYGPIFDSKPGSYQWMTPAGAVMLITPDGMDPTLVIIDAQGYALFKEERDAYKLR